VKAEVAYHEAKVELERRKEERAEVRARYADRLPLGDWVTVAGYKFKRISKSTGKRFSLSGYLGKHKLTREMKPFVSEGNYEDWQVRPTTGGS
jgi:hypothetical protein